MTRTVAGTVLLYDSTILSMIGHGSSATVAQTQGDFMHLLEQSWFSSSRLTEHMMRGTMHEPRVFHALKSKPFV